MNVDGSIARDVLVLQCRGDDDTWPYEVDQVSSDEFDRLELRQMSQTRRAAIQARCARAASALRSQHLASIDEAAAVSQANVRVNLSSVVPSAARDSWTNNAETISSLVELLNLFHLFSDPTPFSPGSPPIPISKERYELVSSPPFPIRQDPHPPPNPRKCGLAPRTPPSTYAPQPITPDPVPWARALGCRKGLVRKSTFSGSRVIGNSLVYGEVGILRYRLA